MFGFGKDKDKEKSPVEHLYEAYKIGGMPLALVVLGALCLLLPFGEALTGAVVKVVDPNTSLIVGGAVVVMGGIAWVIAIQQRTQVQTAMFDLMAEVTKQAATSPKDGANFKVSMENLAVELPKLFALMTASPNEQVPAALPSPAGR